MVKIKFNFCSDIYILAAIVAAELKSKPTQVVSNTFTKNAVETTQPIARCPVCSYNLIDQY